MTKMNPVSEHYLRETAMLDFLNASIQALIARKNWAEMENFKRLQSIYDYVRDETLFGYNSDEVFFL